MREALTNIEANTCIKFRNVNAGEQQYIEVGQAGAGYGQLLKNVLACLILCVFHCTFVQMLFKHWTRFSCHNHQPCSRLCHKDGKNPT